MIFEPLSNQVHVLNKIAWLVWEMCDGQTGIEDIAVKIANDYKVTGYDSVLEDTDAILNEFEKIGLVAHIRKDYLIESKASYAQNHLKPLQENQYTKP